MGAAASAVAEDGEPVAPTDNVVMAATRTKVVDPPVSPDNSARVTDDPVSAIRVVHARPSVDVSMRYPMTGSPPEEVGAVHSANISPGPGVRTKPVGALGSSNGTPVATSLIAPCPALVMAAIFTYLRAPLVRPV